MVGFDNIEINYDKNEFEKEDDVLKIEEVEDRYDIIDEELSKSVENAGSPQRSKKSFVLLDSPVKSKSALNKSDRSIHKSENKSHNSIAKKSENLDIVQDALNDFENNDKTEIKQDDDIVYLHEDI
jgi:hypothetical protein